MSALPVSRRQAIVAALVLAVVVLLAARWGGREAATVPAAKPVRVRAAVSARPQLVVDVTGAVRRPGLYRLRDGARAADAIERAGGPTRTANLEAINLAAQLVDGQQLLVPRRGPPGVAGVTATAGVTSPISLSSATAEQLDTLPGVGPVTAQKIVDYRTANGAFRSVEELDAVPGIGPARIEQLKDLVTP